MDKRLENKRKRLHELQKELKAYTKALKQKKLDPFMEGVLSCASTLVKKQIRKLR